MGGLPTHIHTLTPDTLLHLCTYQVHVIHVCSHTGYPSPPPPLPMCALTDRVPDVADVGGRRVHHFAGGPDGRVGEVEEVDDVGSEQRPVRDGEDLL